MTEKIQALTELLSPTISQGGVELYDIEIVREGGERILRLYIDKPEGVDLNDCERTSRAAEIVLDTHEPISGAYALEVSSPGIERKLSRNNHFIKYIGHDIKLRLFAPIEKRKNFRGKLVNYDNQILTLEEAPDITFQFPRESIAACKLAVFED